MAVRCIVAMLFAAGVPAGAGAPCDWLVVGPGQHPAGRGADHFHVSPAAWTHLTRTTVPEATGCAESLGPAHAISLLDQALGAGREDIVLELLARGVQPRSIAQAAERAAAEDLPLALEALLDMERSPSLSDPLYAAASRGAYRAASLLLDRGADPNGFALLEDALLPSLGGPHLDIAQLLFARGAYLAADRGAATGVALALAAEYASFQFVADLVARGADPNVPSASDGLYPLTAAAGAASKSSWDTLLDSGADARLMACNLRRVELAHLADYPRWFVAAVARERPRCDDPAPAAEHFPDGCGWLAASRPEAPYRSPSPALLRRVSAETAVACASQAGVGGAEATSLFDQALAHRREDVAVALLRLGVAPRSRLEAAHFAAERDLPEALRALLDQDAALAHAPYALRQGPPTTPLARAAAGAYRAAALLLERGADPNLNDPLALAIGANQLHIARHLMEAGARTVGRSPEDAGELLGAAMQGAHPRFVRHLARLGLDPDGRDRQGRHAFERAAGHRGLGGLIRLDNWTALIAEGADPRAWACSLDAGDMARIEAMRGDRHAAWFFDKLDALRRECPSSEATSIP